MPVTGRFYFKLTASKNLVGEYSNRDAGCTHSLTESASRIRPLDKPFDPTSPFEGVYYSLWCEAGWNSFGTAILKIERDSARPDIFKVVWSSVKSHRTVYEGEAMLCDDALIGDYSDVP